MLGRDGLQGTFRIALCGEFRDLMEGNAVAVGGGATLTSPDQATLASKNAAGAAVLPNVGGDGICRVEMPIPRQRFRIEQQERTSARTWIGARRRQPPESLMRPHGRIDKLAFEQNRFVNPPVRKLLASIKINGVGIERLGNHEDLVPSPKHVGIGIVVIGVVKTKRRRSECSILGDLRTGDAGAFFLVRIIFKKSPVLALVLKDKWIGPGATLGRLEPSKTREVRICAGIIERRSVNPAGNSPMLHGFPAEWI